MSKQEVEIKIIFDGNHCSLFLIKNTKDLNQLIKNLSEMIPLISTDLNLNNNYTNCNVSGHNSSEIRDITLAYINAVFDKFLSKKNVWDSPYI